MEPIDDAKKFVDVAVTLIKAAGDNPDVKEAGKELGQAALIVAKTIKNAVLPLAAVNYAIDKARNYFTDGAFVRDLAERLVEIPAEEIIAPKASIAGPALQGLVSFPV